MFRPSAYRPLLRLLWLHSHKGPCSLERLLSLWEDFRGPARLEQGSSILLVDMVHSLRVPMVRRRLSLIG